MAEGLIGRTLGDRYVLEARLGRGGMASVYRARDTRLARAVAVKVLAQDLRGDPSYLQRFEEEARLSAQLRHPNLIEVFDVGSGEDESYLVMELLDGVSLAARTGRTGIPADEVVQIALQVTSGVRVLHAANVVHRDLSANNIMLVSLMGPRRDGDDGRGALHVKVLDLGIAKAEGAKTLTEPGSFVGTLESMAPEQIRGGVVDARADVYALGVLIYRMLTGAAPFAGEAATLIYQHLEVRPTPVAERAPQALPAGLAELVERCLEKDPAARYASADELHDALAEIAAGPEAAPARGSTSPVPVVPELGVAGPRASTGPTAPPRSAFGAPGAQASVRGETVLEGDDAGAPLELEAVVRKGQSLVSATPLTCTVCGTVLQVSTEACPSCGGQHSLAPLTPFRPAGLATRARLPAWLAPLGAFPVGVSKRVAAYGFGLALLRALFFGVGVLTAVLLVVSALALLATYVRSRLDEEA